MASVGTGVSGIPGLPGGRGRDRRGRAAGDRWRPIRGAFGSWTARLAAKLTDAGVPGHRAGPIALAALAGMEGALILCRAEGSSQPLDTIAAELMRLLPARTNQAGA